MWCLGPGAAMAPRVEEPPTETHAAAWVAQLGSCRFPAPGRAAVATTCVPASGALGVLVGQRAGRVSVPGVGRALPPRQRRGGKRLGEVVGEPTQGGLKRGTMQRTSEGPARVQAPTPDPQLTHEPASTPGGLGTGIEQRTPRAYLEGTGAVVQAAHGQTDVAALTRGEPTQLAHGLAGCRAQLADLGGGQRRVADVAEQHSGQTYERVLELGARLGPGTGLTLRRLAASRLARGDAARVGG